jgi:hypothetical protein
MDIEKLPQIATRYKPRPSGTVTVHHDKGVEKKYIPTVYPGLLTKPVDQKRAAPGPATSNVQSTLTTYQWLDIKAPQIGNNSGNVSNSLFDSMPFTTAREQSKPLQTETEILPYDHSETGFSKTVSGKTLKSVTVTLVTSTERAQKVKELVNNNKNAEYYLSSHFVV